MEETILFRRIPMKKLLASFGVLCLLVSLSGCPKKKEEAANETTSSEPVEGASAPADQSGQAAGGEEMQEKKTDAPDAAPASGDTSK